MVDSVNVRVNVSLTENTATTSPNQANAVIFRYEGADTFSKTIVDSTTGEIDLTKIGCEVNLQFELLTTQLKWSLVTYDVIFDQLNDPRGTVWISSVSDKEKGKYSKYKFQFKDFVGKGDRSIEVRAVNSAKQSFNYGLVVAVLPRGGGLPFPHRHDPTIRNGGNQGFFHPALLTAFQTIGAVAGFFATMAFMVHLVGHP